MKANSHPKLPSKDREVSEDLIRVLSGRRSINAICQPDKIKKTALFHPIKSNQIKSNQIQYYFLSPALSV
jgi:hypothetical protein